MNVEIPATIVLSEKGIHVIIKPLSARNKEAVRRSIKPKNITAFSLIAVSENNTVLSAYNLGKEAQEAAVAIVSLLY